MAKHSIKLGIINLTVNEILARMQQAMHQTDLLPGGDYTLSKQSDDGSKRRIVAMPRGLSRDRLPSINEPPDTFTSASLTAWSNATELLLTLYSQPSGGYRSSIIFMADIIEERGTSWIVQIMGAFQTALGTDASLLCDEQDSGEINRRLIKGEDLSHIVLARVRGDDSLPKPLLALVKAELCGPDIYDVAKKNGIRAGLTSKMYLLFSTVDDV
jgi:hypothetical protein